MQKYKVLISRDDYGYIIVKANSEEEARETIESGEWTDEEYTSKGGGITVDNIEILNKRNVTK